MSRDGVMRRALWTTAVLNGVAALLFAFPGSLGRVVGLPAPVPPLYSTLLAAFVLLFGGAYAWLARRPRIDRPLVGMSAIGKAGAFAIVFAFWAAGTVPVTTVAVMSGDLVFAAIFVWWLLGET